MRYSPAADDNSKSKGAQYKHVEWDTMEAQRIRRIERKVPRGWLYIRVHYVDSRKLNVKAWRLDEDQKD